MPLSFPPIYIEEAVKAPVTRYTRRVDIHNADGTLWMRGAPLVSGSVSIDMARSERRTGSVVLLNHDGRLNINRNNGFWYDKVLKIYMGVVADSGSWETMLGTFLIDKIDSKNRQKDLSLSLRDFAKKLSYEIPLPVGFAINTPIETVVRNLAIGGGIPTGSIVTPNTGLFIPEERTFSNGSRWKAMYDVATAYGYDLFFDAGGVLRMEAFTDPYTSQPQYTFQVGVDSNVASIDRNIMDALIYNHVVVEGETPAGVPVYGEAFNNAPLSPTRIEKLGFRTKPTIKNSWVISDAQAQEVAERVLKVSSLERYEADLDTLIAPWLDVNITVEFADPAAVPGDPTRYLLNKLDFDLKLGASKAHVGRVTSVIDPQPLYPATDIYPSSFTFPG